LRGGRRPALTAHPAARHNRKRKMRRPQPTRVAPSPRIAGSRIMSIMPSSALEAFVHMPSRDGMARERSEHPLCRIPQPRGWWATGWLPQDCGIEGRPVREPARNSGSRRATERCGRKPYPGSQTAKEGPRQRPARAAKPTIRRRRALIGLPCAVHAHNRWRPAPPVGATGRATGGDHRHNRLDPPHDSR